MISILFIGAVVVAIAFWALNKEAKTPLFILVKILAAPVIFIEYLTLFWFWAGDGTFNLIAIPAIYLLFLLAHFIFLKRHKEDKKLKRLIVNSIIIFIPILSIVMLVLVGKAFNIDVHVE